MSLKSVVTPNAATSFEWSIGTSTTACCRAAIMQLLLNSTTATVVLLSSLRDVSGKGPGSEASMHSGLFQLKLSASLESGTLRPRNTGLIDLRHVLYEENKPQPPTGIQLRGRMAGRNEQVRQTRES